MKTDSSENGNKPPAGAGCAAPNCSASLTREQFEILHHTIHRAANCKYCGGGKAMDRLVEMGLMEYLGTPSWCPDPFYGITTKGLAALQQNSGVMPPVANITTATVKPK